MLSAQLSSSPVTPGFQDLTRSEFFSELLGTSALHAGLAGFLAVGPCSPLLRRPSRETLQRPAREEKAPKRHGLQAGESTG